MEGNEDKTGPEPMQHSGLAWKNWESQACWAPPCSLVVHRGFHLFLPHFYYLLRLRAVIQTFPDYLKTAHPKGRARPLILEVEQVKHTHCFTGTNFLKLNDFSQSHGQMTTTGKTNGWHPGLSAKGADGVLATQSRGDLVMAKHHSRATCHRKDTFNPCSN